MISSNTGEEGGFQSLPLHVDQDGLRSVFFGNFLCFFKVTLHEPNSQISH